jgi:Glycoside Hydrolase Family 113
MKPSLLPPAFALCGLLVVSAAIPSPAEQSAPLPFFKGVTVSCQTWGIEWQMPEMETALDELKSLGVNSIAIHPYAQIREDGHVLMGRRASASTTHITTPLRWAHERGMSTMLIPHIAYWGTKFLWRGEINFATPEEWNTFFTDYETWIVQMATLAQAEHAEVFCVGLEYSYAQKYDERWRKIIAAVRAVYYGKLTYGANWNDYAEVKFWDELDYVGVLAYFPLTKTADPSASELAAAWEKRCAELEKYSKQHGKQFLFTEIGYNESSRAAAEPWAFKTGGEHATEIQARCIDIALGLPAKHPFLAGMYWWKWYPEIPHHEQENYRLQTAPIKALIAKHWKE